MPDMFCYMSVCKSRVANIIIQATRDVYFREHGCWIVMWWVFANQLLPIQVNAKIDRIKSDRKRKREEKEMPETRALPEMGTELWPFKACQ